MVVLLSVSLYSQEEYIDTVKIPVQDQLDQLKSNDESVNEILLDMKSYIDLARKLKFSGYMQTQYQVSDGIGNGAYPIGAFAGGAFPTSVGSRFQVRRGRLKVQYENDLTFSQYVLQFDVTQNGLGIKDAYINIKDPWVKSWNFKTGVFDRPFGFEVAYSSNMRETPERSRLAQTLFPGERELGAQIEFAPELGDWTNYNLKLGVFNGVLPNSNENDNRKDIIGRVGAILPFDELNFAVDGGISIYQGTVRNTSKFAYTFNELQKQFTVDSTATNAGKNYERQYIGVDGQIIYDIPSLGGISIRGEYITGTQPGTSSSNSFYNPATIQALDIPGGKTKSQIEATSLYQRKFYGFYVSLLQNIGTKHQLLLRYDVLDPNTKVSGSEIGTAGKATTIADLKYSTFGVGYLFHLDDNVKFTFYYEFVSNETVNSAATNAALVPFKSDVKDNVFTFRTQYRFPF